MGKTKSHKEANLDCNVGMRDLDGETFCQKRNPAQNVKNKQAW